MISERWINSIKQNYHICFTFNWTPHQTSGTGQGIGLSSKLHIFDWSEIIRNNYFWFLSIESVTKELWSSSSNTSNETRVPQRTYKIDDTRQEYQHKAAASYTEWRSLQEEGPPHVIGSSIPLYTSHISFISYHDIMHLGWRGFAIVLQYVTEG